MVGQGVHVVIDGANPSLYANLSGLICFWLSIVSFIIGYFYQSIHMSIQRQKSKKSQNHFMGVVVMVDILVVHIQVVVGM